MICRVCVQANIQDRLINHESCLQVFPPEFVETRPVAWESNTDSHVQSNGLDSRAGVPRDMSQGVHPRNGGPTSLLPSQGTVHDTGHESTGFSSAYTELGGPTSLLQVHDSGHDIGQG